jgi:oxygen-independent coproporphyrinogen-3 oxidase
MWGTSLSKIESDFGKVFLTDTLKNIKPFIEKNWLENQDSDLILTSDGKLFADHIASELFITEDDHLKY